MRNDPRSVKARELMEKVTAPGVGTVNGVNWNEKANNLVLPYAALYSLGFKNDEWLTKNFNEKTCNFIKSNKLKVE